MPKQVIVFLIATCQNDISFKVKGRSLAATDVPGSAYSTSTIDELLELGDDDLGQWVRRELQSCCKHINGHSE